MKNHLLLTALLSATTILSAVSPALVSPVDVERIAKQTTVEITKCGKGSGAIFQKNGSTYSVLTVANVVKSSGCELLAPDNTKYQVTQVKAFPNNIDLAVVSFNSSQNYPVAKLIDNSDRVAAGAPLYVSGLPVSSAANTSTFVKGEVVANPPQQQQGKGYSLIYTTNRNISPAHSGSPVWNDRGELIAIQGQGELQRQVVMNTDVRVKTGYNLAITVNTFTKFADSAGIRGYAPVKVAAKPNPVDDLIASALLKERKGDYRGMLADLERGILLDSQNSRLYYSRGVAKSMLGNKDAIEDYNFAISLNLNDALIYNNRGVAKAEFGNKKGAILDYKRAIAIDPNYADPYYNRGKIEFELGNKKASLQDLNRAIDLDPNLDRAYFSRAAVKSSLGDTQGEIENLNRAIALNPNYFQAYYKRGLARAAGDKKGAISDYDRAIALKPKESEIYNERGDLKSQSGDNKGAIADYSSAIILNPSSARAYANRGSIQSKLGDKKAAILDLKKAANRYKQQKQTASYQKVIVEIKRLSS